jgi:adenylate cyclase
VQRQRSKLCKGCWQNLHIPIPLYGIASVPFRVVGIRPSRMNPNTCTMCELMFTRIMRARQITVDVTVLFADLRNYTTLSQSLSGPVVSSVLDAFYDECAAAIWEHDGLLNKTLGDSVMAVFNFPIHQQDHAGMAVHAARDMQNRWRTRRTQLEQVLDLQGNHLGIGIGIDSGNVSFGEFGRSHRDLTAVGTVVNTAARAQSVAAAGEILVTQAVRERSGGEIVSAEGRRYALKGLAEPVELYGA